MNIGKTYIIRIEIDNRVLTYTGKIISNEKSFVTFIDKFGKTWTYNKKNIISLEAIEDER